MTISMSTDYVIKLSWAEHSLNDPDRPKKKYYKWAHSPNIAGIGSDQGQNIRQLLLEVFWYVQLLYHTMGTMIT